MDEFTTQKLFNNVVLTTERYLQTGND